MWMCLRANCKMDMRVLVEDSGGLRSCGVCFLSYFFRFINCCVVSYIFLLFVCICLHYGSWITVSFCRLNFSTAWSTNAVSICQSAGLSRVTRVELSRRFLIKVLGSGDSCMLLVTALHSCKEIVGWQP